MKNNKIFKHAAIGGFLLALSAGFLINFNSQKNRNYKPGDYVPEEDAYFVETVTDPAGKVKAHKFLTPSDPEFSKQKTYANGASIIGDIESVWSTYTGKGTTVAIIDDGFDVNHPEYRRSDGTSAILPTSRYYYSQNPNVYESTVYYKTYEQNPNNIAEDWEDYTQEEEELGYVDSWATHGTNTSTVAAAPINGVGGVGIAPDADILALKIDFSFSAIRAAINYAVEQGADVINMSLGAYAESFTDGFGDQQSGGSTTATFLNTACKAAYDAGVIVIAAAGNEATWHKSYPACNTNVIGVGALYYNSGSTLAPFTNYVGSSQTGEINVDILAPGFVWTAHQEGTKNSITHTYNETQGTSFSSPTVAGAACLWKQKYRNGTPAQFLSQLQSTASNIGGYANKNIPISKYEGYTTDIGPSNITCGRLNVNALLDMNDPFVETTQSHFDISVGEKRQIGIEASNGTLSYTSSNTNVVSVSNSGLIEGKGQGSANITVKATKGTKTAEATISVTVSPQIATTAIAFNPSSIELNVGGTYNAANIITTTPSNATRSFMFESKNESVATVDFETGLITAVSAGTAEIYATSTYGTGEDTLTVTVSQSVTPQNGNITFGNEAGDLTINGQSVNGLDSLGNTWTVNTSGTTSFTQNSNYSQVGSSKNPASSITFSTTLSSEATFSDVTASFGGFSGTVGDVTIKVGDTSIGSGSLSGTADVDVNSTSSASGTTLTILVNNISKGVKAYSISYSYTAGGTPTPPTPVKTLSSISVSGQQTEFSVGDVFVFGGVVTAHYSDESSSDVTASAEFSGYDMSTAGQQTVTVSYTEGTTETTTYNINVASGTSGDETNYSGTFNVSNVGTTWTLTDYSNQSSYLRCPEDGTSSKAVMANIFDGKEIASDVVITLNIATYGGGTNPSANTFKIYNSSDCTTQVTASQSGSLPSSSTFTNTVYTVSKANATASFLDDLVVTITKPGKQIRLSSITVEFTYVAATPKVINSLVATYSGGALYVGQSLDESKISVTAKYTDSVKYPDALLSASDYSITGFDGTSAGNKVVTVTYTGSLQTSISPLTTTFNVNVMADAITSVTATVSKNYHVGETISKSDITLTVTYASSRVEHPTDFTFANDGYQFTYADAASGGANTNKTFTNAITYAANNYSLTVIVSRSAHESLGGVTDTLTRETTGITKDSTSYSNWSGKQDASGAVYAGNSAGGNDSIQLRTTNSNSGIVMTASGGEVKRITVTWQSSTQSSRVLNIYGKNTAYESASDLYNSNKQGTLIGTITNGQSTTLEITDSYLFIGIRSANAAIWLTDIEITFGGSETATNVANYIMYEDTNNQCLTKLDTAISYFENMSKEERNTFMTSDDYVIATARERLQAWLANQEKQISIVDGDYVISNNYSTLSTFTDSDNEVMIIVVTASFLAISLLTCVYLLRKKRKLI